MACKTEWRCEEPEQYEGYNYLVTVLKPESDEETMRFYPGSKKGKFDPTYWGSPETHGLQYFLDIAKYGATREILKCGFYDNVISHESKMLLKVNAKHNSFYYNDSNNAGHKEIKVWNAIDKIKKKMVSRRKIQEQIYDWSKTYNKTKNIILN